MNPSSPLKAAPMTFVIVQPPICSRNRVEAALKTQGQKGRQKLVWHGFGGCCLWPQHTCLWVHVVINKRGKNKEFRKDSEAERILNSMCLSVREVAGEKWRLQLRAIDGKQRVSHFHGDKRALMNLNQCPPGIYHKAKMGRSRLGFSGFLKL